MNNYVVSGTCVIEIPTGNLIFVSDSVRKSQKIAKQLNGGLGFQGWTPEFLLKPNKIPA